MAKIKDILTKYSSKIDSFDLELLIARVLGKTREFVLAHPEYKLTKCQMSNVKCQMSRRRRGEPLAYILGEKEFYGLDFKVNKNVLVPRPETEMLVDLALKEIKKDSRLQITGYRLQDIVIDIGTGSGNIIISLAKQLLLNCHSREDGNPVNFSGSRIKSGMTLIATDISKKALEVAKQNAKLHKVDKKIKFLRGDLLSPALKMLSVVSCQSSVVILANLPYLDQAWKNLLKSSESASLKYEPKIALEGGFNGLDAYRRLAEQIKAWKTKNSDYRAIIFCEIGHLQKAGMKKIFLFADKIKFHKDLSGKWRICEIEIKNQNAKIKNINVK